MRIDDFSSRADAVRALRRRARISIPISVALDNMLLAVVLAAWLVRRLLSRKAPGVAHESRVPGSARALCRARPGPHLGRALSREWPAYLGKYDDLALMPLSLSCCAMRARACGPYGHSPPRWRSFCSSPSCCSRALLPPSRWLQATPDNPVVFKLHLTHRPADGVRGVSVRELARFKAHTPQYGALLWLASCWRRSTFCSSMQGRTGYHPAGLHALYLMSNSRWRAAWGSPAHDAWRCIRVSALDDRACFSGSRLTATPGDCKAGIDGNDDIVDRTALRSFTATAWKSSANIQ